MKDNSFLFMAFMAVLLIAGVAFGIWVLVTPDLPLWAKLLLLK